MKRVTQSEIANELGVDKSTVSLALRRDPSIPAQTVDRVRAMAKRLGYRPDPVLAAIAAARWRREIGGPQVTLAFVSQQRQMPVGGTWVLRAQHGVLNRALELGYALESFCLGDFSDSRKLQKTLLARGIRGLIVGPFFESGPQLTLDWRHFCVVGCGNGSSGHDSAFHAVQYDPFDAVMLAWRHAHAYGYRRPGVVVLEHGPDQILDDDDRRRAAARLCQDRCAPDNRIPPLFATFSQPYEEHAARVLAWYRKWKPDVVLDFNGSAGPILRTLGKVRIPGDVGFAQYSSVKHGQKEIAGILDEVELLGRTAVELLQQLLHANIAGTPGIRVRHDLAPVWMDGNSLPARP